VRILTHLLLLGSLGCAANLWPDAESTSPATEQQGREWLRKASDAQGGAEFAEHRVASLWLRDTWPSWLLRSLVMPWPTNSHLLRQDIAVGTDTSRLTFAEGKEKGTGWGIQNWVTYRFGPDGIVWDPVDDADSTIKFWLPTNAYFPFAAWRLQEATYVRYLGAEEVNGRTLHRVFATWGDEPVVPDVDQYIVYIDAKTERIAYLRYTVKDMSESITGLMRYDDYRAVGKLVLPFSMRVVGSMADDASVVHAYAVERAEMDPALPEGWLLPRPDLRAQK